MSDLRNQVIKLAYENPKYRKHLLPILRKTAKDDKKFEEAVEGKKFKHPETGNDVKFESLPADEQKKVRKKWKKKNKGKDDGGGGSKSLGDKTKKALDKVENEDVKEFVSDGGLNKGSEERKKASDAIKKGEVVDTFMEKADAGVLKNTLSGLKKRLKGEEPDLAEQQDMTEAGVHALGAAATVAGGALGGPPRICHGDDGLDWVGRTRPGHQSSYAVDR